MEALRNDRNEMSEPLEGFKPCNIEDIHYISGSKYGAYRAVLAQFLDSNEECICKKYETSDEAYKARSSLQQAAGAKAFKDKVKVMRRGNAVFVVRL